jgi:hypothetical protein
MTSGSARGRSRARSGRSPMSARHACRESQGHDESFDGRRVRGARRGRRRHDHAPRDLGSRSAPGRDQRVRLPPARLAAGGLADDVRGGLRSVRRRDVAAGGGALHGRTGGRVELLHGVDRRVSHRQTRDFAVDVRRHPPLRRLRRLSLHARGGVGGGGTRRQARPVAARAEHCRRGLPHPGRRALRGADVRPGPRRDPGRADPAAGRGHRGRRPGLDRNVGRRPRGDARTWWNEGRGRGGSRWGCHGPLR